MTIKDEDGTEIKLSVLETPISLDSLRYENENEEVSIKTNEKYRPTDDPKHANIILLQTPISLNNINWENRNKITINVKTVQGTYIRGKRKMQEAKMELWQENVLKIFENSLVYPFIHAINKYKCFVCSELFLEVKELKEHSNGHNIDEYRKELSCRVRDKTIKVDVSHLTCKICLETAANLNSLKLHLNNHGKEIDMNCKDNLIPFKLEGNTFQCQICNENFTKLRILIIHMNKHFNNYSCEVCGSVFISFRLLKIHQKTHESGSFPCDRCDKVFSSSSKRQLHMRGVHLKQLPRRCPICPERFNSDYQRTKHLRVVHNQSNGLFRCETCGREYDLKYHLLKHIRSVHLQERNQECHICHSRFFSKYCLSRHMVIHTGEKNFKCEICGKAYARRRNLRAHFKSHEVAQIICNICNHSCENHATLAAHLNSAHGIM